MCNSDNPVTMILNLIATAMTIVGSLFTKVWAKVLWTVVSALVFGVASYIPQIFHKNTRPQPLISSTTPETLNQFSAADQLASSGRYTEAVSVFRSILRIAPEYPGVHFQIAACLRNTGDLQQAFHEATMARAEAVAGRSGEIRVGDADFILAEILFVKHNWSQAQGVLLQAINEGFPYGCDVSSDPDLNEMNHDPSLAPLVRVVIRDGIRPCTRGQ